MSYDPAEENQRVWPGLPDLDPARQSLRELCGLSRRRPRRRDGRFAARGATTQDLYKMLTKGGER